MSEKERTDSVDSNATADLEYCGKLHLALRYDSEIEGLVVKVLEARDLPIKDVTGSSDPYVKVYLLPDRKKKFQTKVHRKNLNPVFNETFIFRLDDFKLNIVIDFYVPLKIISLLHYLQTIQRK